MAHPTFTANESLERRHCDPPSLWSAVGVGSVIIHLLGFWMLHLLLKGNFNAWLSDVELIPIDVVTLPANATLPTPSSPISGSTSPSRPANTSTQQPSTQPGDRVTTSSSTPSSSQTNAPSPSPQKEQPKPFQEESPTTKPSPNPTPSTNSQTPSPNKNPSPNPTPSNNSPTPPPNSNPSPNPSPGDNSEQGSTFRANPGQLVVANNDRDVINPSLNPGDKFAILKSGNQESFPIDELKALGINLDQTLVLKVNVLIETTGEASISSAQVQQGNLPTDKAEQLASKIIGRWTFEPTYMAGGAVPREYWLTLSISGG
ncbi:MAG TPA: hypothetical protein V6C95_09815 [Coleofasciculaceae cyanobacterium]